MCINKTNIVLFTLAETYSVVEKINCRVVHGTPSLFLSSIYGVTGVYYYNDVVQSINLYYFHVMQCNLCPGQLPPLPNLEQGTNLILDRWKGFNQIIE